MRESADPRDGLVAEFQKRLSSIEMQLSGQHYTPHANQLSPVVIRGAEKFGELGAMVIGLSKGKVPPEGILKAVRVLP
jgi:hypothetical protein